MGDWWDEEPEEPRVPARETQPPRSPLQRSLRPSCLLTPIILVLLLLLLRQRLPPLPYGLLVIGGVWLVCFVVVYLWQAQRGAAED